MRPIRLYILFWTLLLISLPLHTASAQNADKFDLILKGGTIFDGTGKSGFIGDIAIRNDRIVCVCGT